VATVTDRRGLVTHTRPSLSMDIVAKEEREAVNERSEPFHSFYLCLFLRPAAWLTQLLASKIMEEVGEKWDQVNRNSDQQVTTLDWGLPLRVTAFLL